MFAVAAPADFGLRHGRILPQPDPGPVGLLAVDFEGDGRAAAQSEVGGQAEAEHINAIVMSMANGRGKGVCWWEPGNNGAHGFFDAGGDTMPVFGVFHRYTRPILRTDGQ